MGKARVEDQDKEQSKQIAEQRVCDLNRRITGIAKRKN